MNNMDWRIEELSMDKDFEFSNSKAAMKFVDEVSRISKEEQTFPEIHFYSGKIVNVKINKSQETSLDEKDIRLANLINRKG